MSEIRHGERPTYRELKCRCAKCRAAAAKEQQLYLLRRAREGRPLKIDKLGAVRRLRALMSLGWPRRELSRLAGYEADAFGQILNTARAHIHIDTHTRIVDLYERLSMTPGPSASSAQRARQRGWAPPLAWEGLDIDDPATKPYTGKDTPRGHDEIDHAVIERILGGDFTLAPTATAAERRLITTSWTERTGRPTNELSRATGWKTERYTRTTNSTALNNKENNAA